VAPDQGFYFLLRASHVRTPSSQTGEKSYVKIRLSPIFNASTMTYIHLNASALKRQDHKDCDASDCPTTWRAWYSML
jgi:hypothetical protein